MNLHRLLLPAILLVGQLPNMATANDPAATVRSATTAFKEFLDLRVKGIPASLLAEAHGVAIVPNVIKVGFVVGGQRGRGVVIIREKDGSWRAPVFLTLTGGSIGWQAGAQSTDVMLVFRTARSVEGMLKGKFTLGADASAAAGPVGRRVGAATDAQLKAEILSYSRTRGLFAGVSLAGTVLEIDEAANAAFYGQGGAVPQEAVDLVRLIAEVTANPERVESGEAAEALPTPAGPLTSGPAASGPTLGPPTSTGQSFPTLPSESIPARSILESPPVSLAGPPPGPAVREVVADKEALRDALSRSSRQLQTLIDRNWQKFLALPDEVNRSGKRPSVKALRDAAARFDQVATDPQFAALAERQEFAETRDLLQAYLGTLEAGDAPTLALPPPPGTNR
jgi:lipid-binding SYLF domain-containing protein